MPYNYGDLPSVWSLAHGAGLEPALSPVYVPACLPCTSREMVCLLHSGQYHLYKNKSTGPVPLSVTRSLRAESMVPSSRELNIRRHSSQSSVPVGIDLMA